MKQRAYIHLLLLPLWLAGMLWVGRTLAAERHVGAARATVDQPAEHVAHLEQALRLNPWSGGALAGMGRVMTARENWPAVIDYTERALQSLFYADLFRQLANANFQLGSARGDYRLSAYEHYRRFLLYYPDDRDSLYRLAHVCLLLNKPEEAEALARYCLRIHPPQNDVWYDLNVIQAKQGRHREAMHSVHRFLLLGPSYNVRQEAYDRWDWSKHLDDWDRFLRLVESGKMTPKKSGTLQTDRGRAPRTR